MSKLSLWRAISLVCVFCVLAMIASPAETFRTLVSFNGTDGAGPGGGLLVQGLNGNFYGTTDGGGANDQGTVFEITPGGKLTTLHSFHIIDGSSSFAGLVQAANGNFYGTTSSDGANGGGGTVFEITPGGKLTTLHGFHRADGANPLGGVVQATDGNFYGTTPYGGVSSACSSGGGTVFCSSGYGTVFSLSVGLRPFVETRPTSGKVGAAVIILGNHLTGASSVTFNGKVATFRVVSSTEITTTVPKGAITGPVKVKTPSRTLTSNVNFRVS